jgi:hypothetical protein
MKHAALNAMSFNRSFAKHLCATIRGIGAAIIGHLGVSIAQSRKARFPTTRKALWELAEKPFCERLRTGISITQFLHRTQPFLSLFVPICAQNTVREAERGGHTAEPLAILLFWPMAHRQAMLFLYQVTGVFFGFGDANCFDFWEASITNGISVTKISCARGNLSHAEKHVLMPIRDKNERRDQALHVTAHSFPTRGSFRT